MSEIISKQQKMYSEMKDEQIYHIFNNSLNDYKPETQNIILSEIKKRKLNVKSKIWISKKNVNDANKMGVSESLNGLGGFLLFFIFTRVIDITNVFAQLWNFINPINYFGLGIALSLLSYAVYIIINLLSKKKKVIYHVKLYLIVSLIANILESIDNFSEGNVIGSFGLLLSIFGFALWYSYFNVSKRVKNTLIR